MLRVHTRNLGNVEVVCLQGRLVNGETASLREAIGFQSNVNAVVLDLARVSTIDASGLGVMLELRRQAQARGIRFKLMNVTKLVRHVLEVTRLDSVFELAPLAEQKAVVSRAPQTRMMPFARCA
jgi:anti-sigma B factor antagonist